MDSSKSVALFNNVYRQILENKRLREQGKDISIPFPFPRFSEEIPGIQKGRLIITTAGTKIGKTKFTDSMFLYGPYRFVTETDTNIKVKVFYFSLEMSKDDKIKESLSYFLYIYKNIRISPDKMDSIFKHYILEDIIVQAIEELKPTMQQFLSKVEFIDNVRNPYGIYKTVRDYAHSSGHYIDKHGKTLNTEWIEKGLHEEAKKIIRYVPDDPDEFVVIITDHLSILTPEKGESLHEAMSKFSSHYSLAMRDRWKYIVVNVQQQMAAFGSIVCYTKYMGRIKFR